MIVLGVTVQTRRLRVNDASFKAFTSQIPSGWCSQCDRVVKRCRHVTAFYDSPRYAPCGCETHVLRKDPCHTPCTMVEYLDGKRPGRMCNAISATQHWVWPDGRPTVRCLNCGAEWLEPAIGQFIGKAKDE